MSNARKLADNLPTEGSLSGRNLIINGDMRIAQRSTAAHNEGTGYFALDRWRQEKANQDQFTYSVEQVSDGPSGFSKCLRVTTSTAETALASDEFGRIQQIIEGNNLERIGFGTADAKPFTLSFYVKSSVTGNYAVSFYVADANVIYNKAYTINTANTWEYKTLTFPAYTTAGPTIDNTAGLTLNFGLFAGSAKTTVTTNWTSYTQAYLFGGQTANLAATLNSSWRITGCQLEVGSQASPFEHEPVGVTLSKCQRYFQHHQGDYYTIFLNGSIDTTSAYLSGPLTQVMRAKPSFSTANCYLYARPTGTLTYTSTENRCSTDFATIGFSGISGSISNSAGMRFESNNSNGYVRYDSEF
tara:strand:- start:17719 stop:18789 length:1071 start_codon:yes stop_codon:yes gene_type:complete